MATPVISVHNLGKRYHLGKDHSHDTLRDHVGYGIKSLFRRRNGVKPRSEEFWALRDVTFDVQEGEVVGVIGRNGAGKSTLLKILSQITEPTTGEVRVRGRVASLLEVGTGFHSELSGRENVYLNGAILGMTKAEIRRKFDEIVAFAEVEKFLDTPVKRYSSGMYMRLAFAVAAHLDPEILIVDEVLAVGDAEFQNKCLGKMKDVASKGDRTILFVSHNILAVNRLCTKGIFIDSGKISFIGGISDTIARYSLSQQENAPQANSAAHRIGTGEMRYASVAASQDCYTVEEKKVIHFKITRQRSTADPFFISGTLRQGDVNIFQYDSRMLNVWIDPRDEISGSITFEHPWLKPGGYSIDLYICTSLHIIDEFLGGATFRVSECLPYPGVYDSGAYRFGVVHPRFSIDV